MKSLAEMDNTEKGYCLHCFFPEHVAWMVRFFESMALAILDDIRYRQPDIAGIPKGKLQLICKDIVHTIRAEPDLTINPSLFANKLFGGLLGMFSIYSLVTFARVIKHTDIKLTLAIRLLFE